MNHSFISAKWSALVCSKCAKSEAAHSDSYECEACKNIGPVEISGKMLLCQSCIDKESRVSPASNQSSDKLSLEQVINQVNRLCETNQIVNASGDSIKTIIDDAIKGNIKQYTDFFNAKMPSIIELKQLIDADDSITEKKYTLAIALKSRIQYLARVLFQVRAGELEAGAEIRSIQHYMSTLILELRVAIRHQFATETPTYTPIAPKSNKPRASGPRNTEDKLVENYAKMMKIPVEQARKLIANKLRDDCTCSETPGMCKAHS